MKEIVLFLFLQSFNYSTEDLKYQAKNIIRNLAQNSLWEGLKKKVILGFLDEVPLTPPLPPNLGPIIESILLVATINKLFSLVAKLSSSSVQCQLN